MAGRMPEADADFRWESFFQETADALFLLSRRRRILYVNRAWETLTGWSAVQARGLLCSRAHSDAAGSMALLARALCPSREALQGQTIRTRRPAPPNSSAPRSAAAAFWDLAFSPLIGPDGLLGVLGRIQTVTEGAPSSGLLSEKLGELRERMAQQYRFDLFPQTSPAERRLIDQARLASQCRVGILLVGERGAGKSWLARAIHFEGPSRGRAFAALDCLRLPPATIAEIAFGDEGLFSRVDYGTIYLHNVAALHRDLQQRIAAYFKEAAGRGPRIISSCRTDPSEEVQAGQLVEELYSQLATLTLFIPPLRKRRSSLRDLVQRLLERQGHSKESTTTEFAEHTWDLLEAYAWPTNVEELFEVLDNARRRANGGVIEPSHLPTNLRQTVQLKRISGREESVPRPLDDLLKEVEQRLIVLALQRHKGNKSQAAKWLGIWRPRLLRRMEALGISENGVNQDTD
jgi:DNA-binding NtrC family response regulator